MTTTIGRNMSPASDPASLKRQRVLYDEDDLLPDRQRSKRVLRPGIPAPIALEAWPARESPPIRPDDKDGHYVFILGENLGTRYKILSKMGEGTFGRVLECWDRKHKDYVAIKIVRNIEKYRHAAMIELEVLNTLERNDPVGENHCVALREWFDYRGHVCMVFERLGPSLFDFLRKNNYRPFPLLVVQQFARQMLRSVAYLHELKLVHTDLKPENILLVALDGSVGVASAAAAAAAAAAAGEHSLPLPSGARGSSAVSVSSNSHCGAGGSGATASSNEPVRDPRVPVSSEIKVIDFGSATFEEAYHSSIVSTRHYRAPEVILNLGWSYPADMWSLGCILGELITGDAMFQTHENLEHLAMMEAVLGPMPAPLLSRAAKIPANKALFNRTGEHLHWPEGAPNKKSVKAVKRLPDLRHMVLEQGDQSAVPHVGVICDLIGSLLRYEAGERLSALDALNHPFFKLQLDGSGQPQSQLLPTMMRASCVGAGFGGTAGGGGGYTAGGLASGTTTYTVGGGFKAVASQMQRPPAMPTLSGLSGVTTALPMGAAFGGQYHGFGASGPVPGSGGGEDAAAAAEAMMFMMGGGSVGFDGVTSSAALLQSDYWLETLMPPPPCCLQPIVASDSAGGEAGGLFFSGSGSVGGGGVSRTMRPTADGGPSESGCEGGGATTTTTAEPSLAAAFAAESSAEGGNTTTAATTSVVQCLWL